MRQRAILSLLVVSLLALVACSLTQKRVAYNTLATVGYTTENAMKGYLDLVVRGQVKTNGLSEVTRVYTDFQAAYSLALAVAQFDTNAPAATLVLDKQLAVFVAIEQAKGRQ